MLTTPTLSRIIILSEIKKEVTMTLTENSIRAILARAKTEEAKEGIQLADELSDMILFHTRIKENGEKMEQPWNDNNDDDE